MHQYGENVVVHIIKRDVSVLFKFRSGRGSTLVIYNHSLCPYNLQIYADHNQITYS